MKEESLKRSGFSLIELVFSIVIIAISLMSVPMLISESNKGNQYSLIQESVMAARTKLGNILTFQWDDNSIVNNGGANMGLNVVDTNGSANLNRVYIGATPTIYRTGHVEHNHRRKYADIDPLNRATAIGQEGAIIDDIDDFNGTTAQLISSNNSGIKNGNDDYLGATELNISTTVKFINDNPIGNTYLGAGVKTLNFTFNTDATVANSSNIKMIELSVANAFSDEPFIFRAFSSNIGGISQLYSETK